MGEPNEHQMTEKEKMYAGMLYTWDALKEDIGDARDACKDLMWEFNNLGPRKVDEKKALLKKLFGKAERATI